MRHSPLTTLVFSSLLAACASDIGGTSGSSFDESAADFTGDRCGGDPGKEPGPGELCFTGGLCVNVVNAPSHSKYNYPSATSSQYRKPIAYIERSSVDPNGLVAPNFKWSEMMSAGQSSQSTYPYTVLQPHAVASLQRVRDRVGALRVNSGFRAPGYNSTLNGAATRSRHMYGDGFDLAPMSTSLTNLRNACQSAGAGFTKVYTSHVHCDWRNDTVDAKLFGRARIVEDGNPWTQGPMVEASEVVTAELVESDGHVGTTATGFDEGEPLRIWRALDADGDVIDEVVDSYFAIPEGAKVIEVEVGGVTTLREQVGLIRSVPDLPPIAQDRHAAHEHNDHIAP